MGKMLTGMQPHALSESKVENRVATPAIRQEGPVCGWESEMMPDGQGLDTWRMKWVMINNDGHEANVIYLIGEDQDARKPLSSDGFYGSPSPLSSSNEAAISFPAPCQGSAKL